MLFGLAIALYGCCHVVVIVVCSKYRTCFLTYGKPNFFCTLAGLMSTLCSEVSFESSSGFSTLLANFFCCQARFSVINRIALCHNRTNKLLLHRCDESKMTTGSTPVETHSVPRIRVCSNIIKNPDFLKLRFFFFFKRCLSSVSS